MDAWSSVLREFREAAISRRDVAPSVLGDARTFRAIEEL